MTINKTLKLYRVRTETKANDRSMMDSFVVAAEDVIDLTKKLQSQQVCNINDIYEIKVEQEIVCIF